jgi:hypothetical protein
MLRRKAPGKQLHLREHANPIAAGEGADTKDDAGRPALGLDDDHADTLTSF